METPAREVEARGRIGTIGGGVGGQVCSVTGFEESPFGNSGSVTKISRARRGLGLITQRFMGLATGMIWRLGEQNMAICPKR